MNAERELEELDRLWRDGTSCEEFWRLWSDGSWGKRIRETVVDGIRRGERAAIESGVVYVEVGPRYFRSGYFRGWIARALKRAPLSSEQLVRLRRALLRDVDSPRVGPEFEELAKLASAVADKRFVSRLVQRRDMTSGWARRHCERVLELCARRGSATASP